VPRVDNTRSTSHLNPDSGMSERRRPPRRGRGQRPSERNAVETNGEPNPYREEPAEDGPPASDGGRAGSPSEVAIPPAPAAAVIESDVRRDDDGSARPPEANRLDGPRTEHLRSDHSGLRPERDAGGGNDSNDVGTEPTAPPPSSNGMAAPRAEGSYPPREHRNGRRRRRGRDRGPRREHQQQPPTPVVIAPTGETRGWFDPARDGGFVRRAGNSYLAESGDAWVSSQVMRQHGLRKSDLVEAVVGRDQRGRLSVLEIRSINGADPALATKRPDFNSLPASYPERKLTLETGRPAKGGAELIRRAIDLIAPIGYGQRALIVAPARAGKTTLLHSITEGVAINHPNASLLILLVDERPEEVSEAISWGVGEVIASSFDQPAERHVEVTEMVLERARRLVETGRDVVIVLDSLTRMARAHNTAERGTGRTLSGGLDATAMAKPKAFFGSARAIPATAGGGSLTIIATALVETGSRMDDVIFEEFKGTGNCEIKLDRSLAEKRIYPAIDIATSGTRREEKLFRPDQLDSVYTLRRGLSQMPPQSAMEWLIKRIGATPGNDQLLAGL
jgi:transcription termination factor Rho